MTNHSHHPAARTSPAESGSALIYIFLAIAMFAALSFAVANIMRSGNGDPNREIMQLQSTDVIQYAEGLKRAAHGMQIRGIEENRISFDTSGLTGYEPHASCSSDDCRLFRPTGGGTSYSPPPNDWLDPLGDGQALYGEWFFPTGTCVEDVGTGSAGCESDSTDNEELIAILPWIKRELCVQINERLGITNPGGNPPAATGPAWPAANTKFTGTFTEDAVISRPRVTAACLRGNSVPPNDSYFFYKVLIGR